MNTLGDSPITRTRTISTSLLLSVSSKNITIIIIFLLILFLNNFINCRFSHQKLKKGQLMSLVLTCHPMKTAAWK